MTANRGILALTVLGSIGPSAALGQVSSIGAKEREIRAGQPARRLAREAAPRPPNRVYEEYAWIAAPPSTPKTFRPGDLITIIVRERRKWEADADLETKKQFDVTSELDAFLKFTKGGTGSAGFRRGKPNIDYKLDQKLKSEGDSSREDRLTTRLTARVIDVKPNGLLVLEGRARVLHDDEVSSITIVGKCRKEDVTADNTVLSTQLADKEVVISNQGALRAASSRGWIPKLMDWIKPF